MSMYLDSSCCVKTETGYTDFFNIVSGVQQGCILSPFFFLILLDYVSKKSLDDQLYGISWKDSKLSDLDFADDLAVLADTCANMQSATNSLVELAKKVGLRVNTDKTQIRKVACDDDGGISIDGIQLKEVERFTYLGSVLTNNGDSEADIKSRIGKGAAVFSKLENVWKSRRISTKTKLRLFQAIVISTTLYAADTWKSTTKSDHQLNVFQQRCLRRILDVKWEDRITNDEILRIANTQKLSDVIKARIVQLTGHVLRMTDDIPAKHALNWVPPGGKRRRGRPKKTWRQTVMQDLRDVGTNWYQAPTLAKDKTKWRKLMARCRQAGGTR